MDLSAADIQLILEWYRTESQNEPMTNDEISLRTRLEHEASRLGPPVVVRADWREMSDLYNWIDQRSNEHPMSADANRATDKIREALKASTR